MTERPRDRLGRPLAADADPAIVAEPVPDVTGQSDDEVWTLAVALLGRGLPFHAHEVFEQRWRTCAREDRDAWRALAQWGAALTHEARHNPEGARRLAERALETLGSAAAVPACVDRESVQASCLALIGLPDDGPSG